MKLDEAQKKLIQSVKRGNFSGVISALHHGAKPDETRDPFTNSPLVTEAIIRDELPIAKALIYYGANLHEENNLQLTPMDYAKNSKNSAMLQAITEFQAMTVASNKSRQTTNPTSYRNKEKSQQISKRVPKL